MALNFLNKMVISTLGLINFILSLLMLIAIITYVCYTRLIAKEYRNPIISTTFTQIGKNSHLQFHIKNHSKVEVEVFSKIKLKINNEIFEFKTGFYGDKSPCILQPFLEVNGHFELQDLVNEEGKTLKEFVNSGKIGHTKFIFYLKYRKYSKRRKILNFKWKKPYPQKWVYNFKDNVLWFDF